jgi:hypothetical protein
VRETALAIGGGRAFVCGPGSRRGQTEFLGELWRQLVAGKYFDGVLHAGVVRHDVITARTIVEESDDAGVSPAENADDAAFGALGAVTGAGAKDFGEDVIAMHGVFDGDAGNKYVAGVLGGGNVGDDEAVAVVMKDEAAGQFVAAGGKRGRGAGGVGVTLGWRSRGLTFPFWTWKVVTATGKFFDSTPFFEFAEHFQQRMTVGSLEVETSADIVEGGGIGPNL